MEADLGINKCAFLGGHVDFAQFTAVAPDIVGVELVEKEEHREENTLKIIGVGHSVRIRTNNSMVAEICQHSVVEGSIQVVFHYVINVQLVSCGGKVVVADNGSCHDKSPIIRILSAVRKIKEGGTGASVVQWHTCSGNIPKGWSTRSRVANRRSRK